MSITKNEFIRRLKVKKLIYSYSQLERYFPVNRWHLWQFLNNPDYEPSDEVRRRLGIVKRITPPRFTVYAGTPVEKIVRELEALTGKKWYTDEMEMEY